GPDTRRVYSAPARLSLNHWALVGEWTIGKEIAVLEKANGRIAYRFHARDVNLVAGSSSAAKPVRFRVFIDGRPPGTAHGVDADAQGGGTLKEPRLYQLIRQPKPISDRLFEIELLDPGAQ